MQRFAKPALLSCIISGLLLTTTVSSANDVAAAEETTKDSAGLICADGSCDNHFIMLHRLARHGDASATVFLAVAYVSGDGLEQDIPRGVRYMESAARRGVAMANYTLATWYAEGKHVEQDAQLAQEYLDIAVRQGFPQAEYRQALVWLASGEPEKTAQGIELLQLAADSRLQSAMFLLARLKLTGDFVEYDLTGATQLLGQLSRAGHEGARELTRELVRELRAEAIAASSESAGDGGTDLVTLASNLEGDLSIERIQVTSMGFGGLSDSPIARFTYQLDRNFNRGSMFRIQGMECDFATNCASVRPSNRHGSLIDAISDPSN
ncbi:MAG: sel1 repeat family protein [Idiomarina sp.]|nr:sel1 repeat family protein [Idiomarina sp.]